MTLDCQLQFPGLIKVFTYHILYTGSDLVADIGGYLGLFLGLSAFGLVQVLEKFLKEKTHKKAFELAKTTSDILKDSINNRY